MPGTTATPTSSNKYVLKSEELLIVLPTCVLSPISFSQDGKI